MDALVEIFQKIALFFGSKPNRLRLKGARIEVIALVVAKKPTPSILLGQSHYHGMWMPPQEGVRIKETMADALHRCLREECGVDVPADEKERRKMFYTRSIRYVDTLELPEERREERPVADDAVATPFENVRLRSKAYWLATVIVRDIADLPVKADGIEMEKLLWYAPNEARVLIEKTNHAPKAQLLALCVDLAMKDFRGAPKVPSGD